MSSDVELLLKVSQLANESVEVTSETCMHHVCAYDPACRQIFSLLGSA
jgi:hypothetical protein